MVILTIKDYDQTADFVAHYFQNKTIGSVWGNHGRFVFWERNNEKIGNIYQPDRLFSRNPILAVALLMKLGVQ